MNNFISKLVIETSGWVVPFVESVLAIGPFSMAVIQLLKIPLRKRFFTSRVIEWLDNPLSGDRNRSLVAPWPLGNFLRLLRWAKDTSLKSELVDLSTAGDANALFVLPIEQLCGQISAASQIIVDFPARHVRLLRALVNLPKEDKARGEVGEDMAVLIAWSERRSGKKLDEGDMSRLQYHIGDRQRISQDRLADSRNRISQRIQRNIDSLQISSAFAWRSMLKILAFAISGSFALLGVLVLTPGGNAGPKSIFVLCAALMGTIGAQVSRDLVAVVEKLRK